MAIDLFRLYLNQAFNLSALDVRLRKVIVISVKTKLGNLKEQACFVSCPVFFFFLTSFKQAELSTR